MLKIIYNRAPLGLYILIIALVFILIGLTLKPVKEMFANTNTPIVDAGYGPFDYGLSSTKVSDQTAGTMDYMYEQKKKGETGNRKGNILGYMS